MEKKIRIVRRISNSVSFEHIEFEVHFGQLILISDHRNFHEICDNYSFAISSIWSKIIQEIF